MNEAVDRAAKYAIFDALEEGGLPKDEVDHILWKARYSTGKLTYNYTYADTVGAVKDTIRDYINSGHEWLDYVPILREALAAGRRALDEPVDQHECKSWEEVINYRRHGRKKGARQYYRDPNVWGMWNSDRCSKCWKDQSKRSHQYYR